MYQLTNDPNIIQRLSDGVFIPKSLDNADYKEYINWISEGNKPLEAKGI